MTEHVGFVPIEAVRLSSKTPKRGGRLFLAMLAATSGFLFGCDGRQSGSGNRTDSTRSTYCREDSYTTTYTGQPPTSSETQTMAKSSQNERVTGAQMKDPSQTAEVGKPVEWIVTICNS